MLASLNVAIRLLVGSLVCSHNVETSFSLSCISGTGAFKSVSLLLLTFGNQFAVALLTLINIFLCRFLVLWVSW